MPSTTSSFSTGRSRDISLHDTDLVEEDLIMTSTRQSRDIPVHDAFGVQAGPVYTSHLVSSPPPIRYHHHLYYRLRSRFRRLTAGFRHNNDHAVSDQDQSPWPPVGHRPLERQRAQYWDRQARDDQQPPDSHTQDLYASTMLPLCLPGPRISWPQNHSTSPSCPTMASGAYPAMSIGEVPCRALSPSPPVTIVPYPDATTSARDSDVALGDQDVEDPNNSLPARIDEILAPMPSFAKTHNRPTDHQAPDSQALAIATMRAVPSSGPALRSSNVEHPNINALLPQSRNEVASNDDYLPTFVGISKAASLADMGHLKLDIDVGTRRRVDGCERKLFWGDFDDAVHMLPALCEPHKTRLTQLYLRIRRSQDRSDRDVMDTLMLSLKDYLFGIFAVHVIMDADDDLGDKNHNFHDYLPHLGHLCIEGQTTASRFMCFPLRGLRRIDVVVKMSFNEILEILDQAEGLDLLVLDFHSGRGDSSNPTHTMDSLWPTLQDVRLPPAIHITADDPTALLPYFRAASSTTDLRLIVTGNECPAEVAELFVYPRLWKLDVEGCSAAVGDSLGW